MFGKMFERKLSYESIIEVAEDENDRNRSRPTVINNRQFRFRYTLENL